MGIISRGVSKKVAYKKEAGGWGVIAGAASGKYIRRVTADFNLSKETFESNEIRTDFQVADMRHSMRSAEGSINGELSPGAYSDFMQSLVARDFTAAPAGTSATITIAASGDLWTLTRAAGSFLTDGIQVGNIVRMTGAGLNAANQGNNLLVCAVTATVLTVKVLSGTNLVAESAIASVTVGGVGKVTYAPLSGHTDDSYTIEEWYSDILQSEVYTGMKVGSMNVQLPSTGLTTVDLSFMGKNLEQTGNTQYFTSPTAAPTNGIFAAVNGALVVNGVPRAVITSADISIERGLEQAQVVGSNFASSVFTGRIRVNGNFSTYFEDGTFRDYFKDENTVSLVLALTSDNSKTATAISLCLPKIKLGSAQKSDSEMGIVQQHSFVALLNDVTTAGLPATTIQIQDTSI